MDWLKLDLEEKELKKRYKTLRALRLEINKDLKEIMGKYPSKDKNVFKMITINSSSWSGMCQKIAIFKGITREIAALNGSTPEIVETTVKTFKPKVLENSPFVSEEARLIFYLTEIDGLKRATALGINIDMYKDKSLAKRWRDNIAKKIHPDVCNIKSANRAISKLNSIYNEMTLDE